MVLKDVFAGIALAALGIPEVMGYTKIAQTRLVAAVAELGSLAHYSRAR